MSRMISEPSVPLFTFCRQLFDSNQCIQDHCDHVQKGDCFLALSGLNQDGHQFILKAIQNGASSLVVESTQQIPKDFRGSVYVVPSTQKICSLLLNHYYDFPSEKLFCVGVTGTNGKTTISYMVEHIFSKQGWRTGVIGTIQNYLEKKTWSAFLTTPKAIDFQKQLYQFVKLKAQAAVVEVSSIGLHQGRVNHTDFNVVIFSNLSRDHLDYHQSMEAYLKSKKKLFEISKNSQCVAVLNADDSSVYEYSKSCPIPFVSYGQSANDFRFEIRKEYFGYTEGYLFFNLKKYFFKFPIMGECNVSNAVAAIATAVQAGFSIESSISSLQSFKGVSGRLEVIRLNHPSVMVDYAHTPEALKTVLLALRKIASDGQKIITVFGCGGNRDVGKRTQMGKVASQYSDLCIVTSDNPREEDPQCIIQDILMGIKDVSKVMIEIDREKGIKKSLELATKKDMVLIAGKGHELFQIIKGQKIEFSDAQVVKDFYQSTNKSNNNGLLKS